MNQFLAKNKVNLEKMFLVIFLYIKDVFSYLFVYIYDHIFSVYPD